MTDARLSLQLYTIRDDLARDRDGVLERVAAVGYDAVEPHRILDDTAGLAAALRRHGLAAPSAHARMLDADAEAVFAAAAELGVWTLVQPASPREGWRTRDGVAGLARALDELSRRARPFGIRIGYHNHAFEFDEAEWAADPERTTLEVLSDDLESDVVLEVDTYWAAVGGVDVAAMIARLGDRVGLLHVKDGPITRESADQVAVGDGRMPVGDILAAAPGALPIVELDAHRGDVFDAVRRSFSYLSTLRRTGRWT